MSDKELIEKLKHILHLLERQSGQVPTIAQLARKLNVNETAVKHALRLLADDNKQEGTSAYYTSLLDILLEENTLFLRVIDEEGAPLGLIPTKEAFRLTHEKGLELFLIEPSASPPVARIMNYGRYCYRIEKRIQSNKKNWLAKTQKDIRLRYEIAEHDYQNKLKQAQLFLGKGEQVKVQITLAGNETEHADLAIKLLLRLANDLQDRATIDTLPSLKAGAVALLLIPTDSRTVSRSELD